MISRVRSRRNLEIQWHELASVRSLSSHLARNEITESKEEKPGFYRESIALLKKGHCKQALHFMERRKQEDSYFNESEVYASLLKECTEMKALVEGKQIHSHMKLNGLVHSNLLNNLLLQMYIRCGSYADAKQVFDRMPNKVIESWSLMFSAYAKSGSTEAIFNLLYEIEVARVNPNGAICVTILKFLNNLRTLNIIHTYIVFHGLDVSNLYVVNTLLDMYCKYGCIMDPVYLFRNVPILSIISWNTIISGHVQQDFFGKAFDLFHVMKAMSFMPDEVTFLSIIKACTNKLQFLRQLHVEIHANGLSSHSFVASALIDMYAAFEDMEYARTVFENVGVRDVPLWNSIILGYAEHGDVLEAIKLFAEMEKHKMVPDKVTFLCLLKACVNLRHLSMAQKIYTRIMECGLEEGAFISSALVDMYAKCGNLEEAYHVFERTRLQDLVSWNAIIAGYCAHQHAVEAIELFQRMRKASVKPDRVTFLSVLKACASLGAFQQGRSIHNCLLNNGCDSEASVGSALIDMYGKCGSVYHAREVFDKMHKRDAVPSSAMIAGYAQHGNAQDAFGLFLQMQRESIPVDDVTFVGILTACSRAGLVETGFMCFDIMRKEHGITPTGEICACMVDLLARAGQLDESFLFINAVEIESTASVWMALLSACKVSGDVKLAQYCSGRVRDLDPYCTSAFVLLSDAYVITEVAD